MFLALKEMKKEKARFFLIISIFVLISYLVYFLLGLAYGLAVDNKTAVDQWSASKVILSGGSNNNISSSMMDQAGLEEELSDRDYALLNLARSAAYKNGSELERNTVDITLIGMNPESDHFPEIVEGEAIQDDKDVIAASSLKEEEGLEIGDELKLAMNGSIFKIVGFTNDYKFNTSPVIYTKLKESSAASIIYRPMEEEEAEEPASEENAQAAESSDTSENAEVEDNTDAQENTQAAESQAAEGGQDQQSGPPADVDAEAGATSEAPERVSAALIFDNEDLDISDDYDVVGIDKFTNEIPGYYAQLLTFGLMIGFLILIAAIVLGVFLYIITIQKKKIFGIMKIQGISNSYISKSVIVQTFLVSLIGVGIGLGLTYLTNIFLPATVPFRTNILFYGIITLVMIITALLGAIFSVKSVSKVDPLEVI